MSERQETALNRFFDVKIGALLLDALPKKTYTRLLDLGGKVPIPRFVRRSLYGIFSHLYGAEISEADRALEDYEDFDTFFTRKLKPGCRVLCSGQGKVLCPSDSSLVNVDRLKDGSLLQSKGVRYSAEGLLASKDLARQFEGGDAVTLYLRPRDYHRVHFPASGKVERVYHIPGERYPVIPLAVSSVEGLYRKNERVVVVQDTEAYGKVITVMVSALGVGNISLSWGSNGALSTGALKTREETRFPSLEGIEVKAGDELGAFHLGSSVIVLFQKGRVALSDMRPGQRVHMGQALGEVEKEANRAAQQTLGDTGRGSDFS